MLSGPMGIMLSDPMRTANQFYNNKSTHLSKSSITELGIESKVRNRVFHCNMQDGRSQDVLLLGRLMGLMIRDWSMRLGCRTSGAYHLDSSGRQVLLSCALDRQSHGPLAF